MGWPTATFNSRGSDALFWHLQVLHMPHAGKTLIQNKNLKRGILVFTKHAMYVEREEGEFISYRLLVYILPTRFSSWKTPRPDSYHLCPTKEVRERTLNSAFCPRYTRQGPDVSLLTSHPLPQCYKVHRNLPLAHLPYPPSLTPSAEFPRSGKKHLYCQHPALRLI